MRRLVLLSAGFLALSTATASAQSIYGPGGLLLNPTADFAPKGNLSPAALWIPSKDPAGGNKNLYSLGANYAATDKLEVGATYLKLAPGGDKPDGSFGGSVKYKLLQGGGPCTWRPDIAVGASILGGGDLDARTAFVAARFTPLPDYTGHPVHLHAGALYANKLYGGKRNDTALYVGADVGLTPNLAAFAEYRQKLKLEGTGDPDVHAPNAIGLVYKPSDYYKLVVAYANNGQSTGNRLAIGVGFTLGSRRPTK
jgi:hypothetical protein